MKVSGWGRYPVVDTDILAPRTIEAAQIAIKRGGVARGNGRAYGDAAIGAERTIAMGQIDRLRSFDPTTGELTVEAGVLLADIIRIFGPRGFFPRVVPGTCFVTVGGAIASDVHGKNHHRDGGFGAQVKTLTLATGAGELIEVSPFENRDLFLATVGGMGLTGIIVEATLQLRPIETGWIRQNTLVAPDLTKAIKILDKFNDATYSVAWVDCLAKGSKLGRSLIFLGEHATSEDPDLKADGVNLYPAPITQRFSVPIDFPSFALNRWSVAAFNELYFQLGARQSGRPFLKPAIPYFFPLDSIGAWNRLYGRRGFVQHQCVLPAGGAVHVLAEMLGRIAARGDTSPLAVLKKLGSSPGMLSFPLAGYTLALDFPVSPGLLNFLEELDRLVVSAGGRLYLAKDARQSQTTFEAGYPNLRQFREIRRLLDPAGRVRSRLSDRLGI